MGDSFSHFILAAPVPHTGPETGDTHHADQPKAEFNPQVRCPGPANIFGSATILKSRDLTPPQGGFLVSHQSQVVWLHRLLSLRGSDPLEMSSTAPRCEFVMSSSPQTPPLPIASQH